VVLVVIALAGHHGGAGDEQDDGSEECGRFHDGPPVVATADVDCVRAVCAAVMK